jgi:hypothetical protein
MYTQEDLQLWKSMYEDVYSVPIMNQEFVFRTLGREEYKNILDKDLPIAEEQELVCQTAVLYPEGFDFKHSPAGYAATLSNLILEYSYLLPGQAKKILDQYREEMMIFDYQADCIIHEAFPEFKIEEIPQWPMKKMMYYLSRAEWVLMNLRGVPLVPVDQQLAEALEGQDQTQQNTPQQHTQVTQNGQLSKEEVERMLSQATGQRISLNHETKVGELMPELSWFKAEEQLKGDFD